MPTAASTMGNQPCLWRYPGGHLEIVKLLARLLGVSGVTHVNAVIERYQRRNARRRRANRLLHARRSLEQR
eukprot:m.37265 g.37265  ORF g.37265 m.37265 type:complete len:71 (-) comp13041_c0_seq1:372-584(-)